MKYLSYPFFILAVGLFIMGGWVSYETDTILTMMPYAVSSTAAGVIAVAALQMD